MNYKQKMLTELLDLTEKIVKLEKYIKNEKQKMGNVIDEKLETQLTVMYQYRGILTERMLCILDDDNKLGECKDGNN